LCLGLGLETQQGLRLGRDTECVSAYRHWSIYTAKTIAIYTDLANQQHQ